jgi:lipoprotein NlpI
MRGVIRPGLLMAMLLATATTAFCDPVVDLLARGNAKYDQGDWDGAIADYTQALQLKSDYEPAYNNRGNAERQKGDWDAAIRDYTQAIELKPDGETAFGLGGAKEKTGSQWGGTIPDFSKAAETDLRTNVALPFKNRADVKYDKRDLDGALSDYSQAIALKPDFAEAFNGRGRVKKDQNDLEGALADYNQAIELRPSFAEPYAWRAMAKRDKGDLAGALADCSKAIELNPKFIWAYHTRGCLLYDGRDFSHALADFRKEVDLDSSNDYARFRLWLVRSRLGKQEAATTELGTYLRNRSTGKPDDWESKIGGFLAGQLAESEFLAAANHGPQKTDAGQLCQSYFYAGSKHLLAGQTAPATDDFQKATGTEAKACFEYISAAAELRFLKAQKN